MPVEVEAEKATPATISPNGKKAVTKKAARKVKKTPSRAKAGSKVKKAKAKVKIPSLRAGDASCSDPADEAIPD